MHIHKKSTQFSNSIKVLLFLLITYTSWCNALTQEEAREAVRSAGDEKETPTRYCGRRLNRMMKFICLKEVREALVGSISKKSVDPSEMVDFYDRPDNYEEVDTLRNRFNANGFDDILPFITLNDFTASQLQAKNRNRRGIIDECCRNPCDWYSLVKYCPNKTG